MDQDLEYLACLELEDFDALEMDSWSAIWTLDELGLAINRLSLVVELSLPRLVC